MKFFTMLAVFLLVLAFGKVSYAQSGPIAPPGEVCNATNNLQGQFSVPISHDECVLYVQSAQTQNPSEIAASCKILQSEGELAPGPQAFGQCVAAFQSGDFGATTTSVGVLGLLIACWMGWKAFRMRRGLVCES